MNTFYTVQSVNLSNKTSPGYTMPSYSSTATTTSKSSRSTEFRGSTNPDEDWTKISDLAERRRIQNRIAQRNYRKKLKRRLEDLERRAHSRSLSPSSEEAEANAQAETIPTTTIDAPVTTYSTTASIYSSAPLLESATITSIDSFPSISASAMTSSEIFPSQYRTANSVSGSYSPYSSPSSLASSPASSVIDPIGSYSSYYYPSYSTSSAGSTPEMSCSETFAPYSYTSRLGSYDNFEDVKPAIFDEDSSLPSGTIDPFCLSFEPSNLASNYYSLDYPTTPLFDIKPEPTAV